MQEAGFFLKLPVFVALISWIAWFAGWLVTEWTACCLARRGLRGQGGRDQAWRPLLVMAFVGGVLAVIVWCGYGSVAPHPGDISDTAGAGNVFIGAITTGLWWVGWLCVLAGPAGALASATKLSRAIERRRTLKREARDLSEVGRNAGGPIGRRKGRNIVICCDGTGNRADRADKRRREDAGVDPAYGAISNGHLAAGEPVRATTNVYKLFRALKNNEAQLAWYDPGVGTDSSPSSQRVGRVGKMAATIGIRPVALVSWLGAAFLRLMEAATGGGVQDNVVEAYTLLARTYRPGDRIYLIGFSRGAWTVRCLATVISCCGVLKPSCRRYAEDVVYFVKDRERRDDPVYMREDVTDMSARVAFLGAFDTVAALGFPLWGWWFRCLFMSPKIAWTKNPLSICDKVYHAVSMDERRSQYFVTLFDETGMEGRIEQVWFRGDHSDVGGGRVDAALSDITLQWMIDKAKDNKLEFDERESADLSLRGDPLGFIHDELEVRRHWRLFCSWPRWVPVHRPEDDTSTGHGWLHSSVYERARKMHAAGRHDLVFLTDGGPVELEVPGNCEWYRTSIVLETGRTYRVAWVDGKSGRWRDGANAECGPAGEPAVSVCRLLLTHIFLALGMPRLQMFRFPGTTEDGQPDWNKHKAQMPRMTLIATVAHPRAWPPKEGGFWELVRLFFWRDPVQLVEQVAPVGVDLKTPGDTVYLRIDGTVPDGMLWMFANDHWMAACDNSGAVRLTVEHVAAREPDKPLWTLKREKVSTPCEHEKLPRLNEQTRNDQTNEEQPRTVWSRDPKFSPPSGIVKEMLTRAGRIGRRAGRPAAERPHATADERQLETQHPGR